MALGAVICWGNKVHSVCIQQLLAYRESFSGLLLINGDRVAATILRDNHAWHIGQAIANVDDVGERDWALNFRHVLVDCLTQVFFAFVDPEQILCFCRIGYEELWKAGYIIVIEMVFGRIDSVEMLPNSCTFQDLAHTS